MAPSNNNNNKKRLFEESGMTADERRLLRKQQRQLGERIAHDERGAKENAGNNADDNDDNANDAVEKQDSMEFLDNARKENNELFNSVAFTREAVLDAENADMIAAKTLQQVDRMVQVPRYDAVKFSTKLRQKCGRGQFDWLMLGREVGICFNSVPSSVRFLAGTLDEEKEKVQRQQVKRGPRKKAVEDDEEEARPENITGKEKDGDKADKLSAAEKTMKKIKSRLIERSKENYEAAVEKAQETGDANIQQEAQEFGEEVDGVKFLFNPKSFTQTVENIFHFSFLIKRNEAGIVVRPPSEATQVKRPGLRVVSHPSLDEDNQGETKQAVVAFNMRDWRRICKAHQLKEGDIKHRTGSKQTKTNHASSDQSP